MIDIGQDLAEVFEKIARTRVAVRLEQNCKAMFRPGSTNTGEGRGDFVGMVSIVIDHRNTLSINKSIAANLAASPNPLKGA